MQTLGSIEAVSALLDRLEIGQPLSHGALTVVPLLAPAQADPDWLTLSEAGAAVTIAEVSEAGEVPALSLVNDADRPVLLLDGEELIGAKQNRILNTTVLAAAHAAVRLPVSCVEQGRWRYRGTRFDAGDASVFASARARKAARVSTSLREVRIHLSDQGEIWRDVAGKASQHRVASPTGAQGILAQARRALAPRPGQVGALVAVAGRWIGLDLLPSPGLFERAWPRLCAGYAAEAVGRDERAPAPDPHALLKDLAQAPAEDAPAVGLGREYRLAGNAMAGAALVVEDKVAHLMAFPEWHRDA